MTYEELTEINFGKPSIDLINKFIREQESMSIFYRHNLKKDKKSYWKGKIMNSTKIINKLINLGTTLYGDEFKSEDMGLTTIEIDIVMKEQK